MKAIAEYFRDLAADDRYFGAEPPTPDAEMLARIAEREISRRVEAHEEHGKIHLRADESSAAAEALTYAAPLAGAAAETLPAEDETPAETARDETVEDVKEAAAPVIEAYEPEEAAAESEPEAEEAADVTPEAVAEEREALEGRGAEADEPAPDAEEGAIASVEVVIETTEEIVESTDIAAFLADAEAEALDEAGPDVADASDMTDETDDLVMEDATEAVDTAAPEAQAVETDSVAEKLRRIRSVVSQSDVDYEVSEYSEDEHAQDVLEGPSDELDSLLTSSDEETEGEDFIDETPADLVEAVSEEAFDEADEATAEDVIEEPPEAEAAAEPEHEAEDDVLGALMADLEAQPEDLAADDETPEAEAADIAEDALEEEAAEAEAQDQHVLLDEDTLSQLLADATPIESAPQPEVPETAADLDVDTAEELHDEEVPAPLRAELDDSLELEAETEEAEETPEPLVLGNEARVTDAEAAPTDEEPEAAREMNARVLKLKRAEFEEAIAQGVIEEDVEQDDEALLSPEAEADLQRELAAVEAELAQPEPDEAAEDLRADALELEVEIEDAELVEPEMAEAELAEPELVEPEMAEAEMPEPELAEAELAEPELGEPEMAEDEMPEPEMAEPEIAKAHLAEAEMAEAEIAPEPERAEKEVTDLEDIPGEAAEAEDEAEAATAGPAEAEVAEADEKEAPVAEEKPRRGLSRLLGIGKRAPEDEERIFEEADSQMGDKDASMRRTAIQHLRAAVAATRAEKNAGVDVDKGVDETPYRTDLAEVVRPRRPTSAPPTMRSERPSDQRPAPLKLVAEQRVDVERSPVRPRRVSAVAAQAPHSPDGGFTAFAEEMGATELSELLEAAAAYMSDVEGHAEFTRPMLMGKLKEVKHDSYSREDGLRSFGQLLREGKLRKLKGGRFAATEETEFRAEARNAS